MPKHVSKALKPEEKKHARYSASGASRWIACSGSIALSEKVEPEPDSEASKEGTRAHECLEFMLKNKNPDAAERILLKSHPADMVKHVRWAYDEIMADYETFGGDLHSETKSDITPIVEGVTEHPTWGTNDAVLVRVGRHLYVYDFKYGYGIVDPEENPQMIFYALGIAHEHFYKFKRVVLVILQPRPEHPDGPRRQWATDVETLQDWGEKFIDAIARCEDPLDQEYVPGDHCRFCPAKIICPGVSTEALRDVSLDFGPLDDTPVAALVVPEKKDFAHLYPDIGRALEAAEKLDIWIKAVREFAHAELMRGLPVRGWKLVAKRASREWTDEVKAAAAASRLIDEKAFSTKLLSPAQMEKAMRYKPGAFERMEGFIESKSSGLTIAPEGDKRAAVDPVAEAFPDDLNDEIPDENLSKNSRRPSEKSVTKKRSKL